MMMEIKNKIFWCGKKDWELRTFHGHELSTHRGSSYNSYLIKDKKTVLVDTVWSPYKEEFVEALEKDVGIRNIDMIVINHLEPDHGGSLDYLMSFKPEIPVYCTKNGAEIIRKYFQKERNFVIVKTGDSVNIGEYNLVFVEMQMIHWPDSMMTYVKGADTLLSSDAFGQHFAAYSLFNDEVDECELYQEAIKYYANILTPFSPLIKKKIEQIKALGLPVEMIAPGHGVIWRKNPLQIVEKYYEWAQDYNEGHAILIYDTMYEATSRMAHAISEGLALRGIKFKLFNASVSDYSDLLTEIFKAKAVLIGSCTVNNTVLRSISALLEEIKALKFKGKIGAGFGSYGWSGESPKIINRLLEESEFKVPLAPLSFKYTPTTEELSQCRDFGEKFAISMKE